MRALLACCVVIASGVLTLGAAHADCTVRSSDVADYLKQNPGWRIVQVSDLQRDDQGFWKTHQGSQCPGMTQVDFDGSGRPFHALGLLGHIEGSQHQKIVVFRRNRTRIEEHVLEKSFQSASPVVIIRTPPGTAKEWDSTRVVSIAHDSLDIVQYEASAHQFYYADGKFQTIWTSD